MMTPPALIGRGVAKMSHRELRDAVLSTRRRRIAAPRQTHPEFLRVACGIACHRWRAVCDEIALTGFATRLAAAHCAARDAWAKRLGHGIAMSEVHLVDAGDDTFQAYLKLGRTA